MKRKSSSGGRLPYLHPEVFSLSDSKPLSLLQNYSVLLINRREYELWDTDPIDDYLDYEDEGEL